MKRRRRRPHSLIGRSLQTTTTHNANPNPSGPTKTNRLLVSEIPGMLAVLSYGTPMLALFRYITCVIIYTLLADPINRATKRT